MTIKAGRKDEIDLLKYVIEGSPDKYRGFVFDKIPNENNKDTHTKKVVLKRI